VDTFSATDSELYSPSGSGQRRDRTGHTHSTYYPSILVKLLPILIEKYCIRKKKDIKKHRCRKDNNEASSPQEVKSMSSKTVSDTIPYTFSVIYNVLLCNKT
jgi:hypothetical protein